MMASVLEINGCKHYFLNENGEQMMYFIHSPYLVEEDYSIKHPLGRVYKPKSCIDTIIRFVRQSNNSTLMFRLTDWNVPTNPYYVQLRQVRKSIVEFTRKDGYCV